MRRIERPDVVRLLTFSCHERRQLLGAPDARDTVTDQLLRTHTRHAFRLHAWVIMPEHVHLIARFDESTASNVLHTLRSGSAKRLLSSWRTRGSPLLRVAMTRRGVARVWQAGPGHDHVIRSRRAVLEKIAYVHANPVRRGLSQTQEGWRWSSARWWMGDRTTGIPCDDV